MSFILKYLKAFFKSIGTYCLRYPLAAAVTVFLVIFALFILLSGKDFPQLGGILGKLWGKKAKALNVREIPPPKRVDDTGKSIQPGQSDDQGYIQSPTQLEIVEPTIFTDPDVITVVHPDKGKIDINLPKGVQNTDIKEVILISPNVIEVKNNDTGVNTSKILEFLQ